MTSKETTVPHWSTFKPRSPARAAGLPFVTSRTITPDTPHCRAYASARMRIPRPARCTFPYLINCGTMRSTVSTGTAKPIPALWPVELTIWVFTPIIRPAESRSGPPEFPGLIDASVWMTSSIVVLFSDWISRPRALITPTVKV